MFKFTAKELGERLVNNFKFTPEPPRVNQLNTLIMAFIITWSKGVLHREEWYQYMNAGFNPLKVMNENWEKFGFKEQLSIGQLIDMMAENKITREMLLKAFEIEYS